MNSPLIRLNEQYLIGAIEMELVGSILYYSYIKSYKFTMHKADEPGNIIIQVEVHTDLEWEFFHIKDLNKNTTIEALASLTGNLCDRINKWLDRSA